MSTNLCLRSVLLQLCCALSFALCMPGGAHAQQGGQIDGAEVDRAAKKAKEQFDSIKPEAIQAGSKKALEPWRDGSAEKAMRANGQTMPKMDAMPVLKVVPNVDLGALASQLKQGPVGPLPQLSDQPRLYVFVTMAMSAESLKSLLSQAYRANASVVLRGFVDGSMKQTNLALKKVIGPEGRGLSIDPDAFDRYGVQRVPSFVLVKPASAYASACASQKCTEGDNFVMISGDVSVDYALEQIESRSRRFKNEARMFLKRIRG